MFLISICKLVLHLPINLHIWHVLNVNLTDKVMNSISTLYQRWYNLFLASLSHSKDIKIDGDSREAERRWKILVTSVGLNKNLAHMPQCAPLKTLVMNVNVCVREQNIASLWGLLKEVNFLWKHFQIALETKATWSAINKTTTLLQCTLFRHFGVSLKLDNYWSVMNRPKGNFGLTWKKDSPVPIYHEL